VLGPVSVRACRPGSPPTGLHPPIDVGVGDHRRRPNDHNPPSIRAFYCSKYLSGCISLAQRGSHLPGSSGTRKWPSNVLRPQSPLAAENPAAALTLALCERQCEQLIWEVSEGLATLYGRNLRFLARTDLSSDASAPHKLMIQYHHLEHA
jgi:hypothetical protein